MGGIADVPHSSAPAKGPSSGRSRARFGIDASEALGGLDDYATLNAFFVRRLRAQGRGAGRGRRKTWPRPSMASSVRSGSCRPGGPSRPRDVATQRLTSSRVKRNLSATRAGSFSLCTWRPVTTTGSTHPCPVRSHWPATFPEAAAGKRGFVRPHRRSPPTQRARHLLQRRCPGSSGPGGDRSV